MHNTITHRSETKAQRYLGTAQQYTELSTLLWVQGLAQCRKLVHMYATVIHMSEADVQCWLGTWTTYRYTEHAILTWSQKFSSMPWVELVCINRNKWWISCHVLYTARKLKLSQIIVVVTCCLAIKLTSIFTYRTLISMVFTYCSAHVNIIWWCTVCYMYK